MARSTLAEEFEKLQFGGSTFGQYRTFLDPTNDLSPSESEFPDLLQSSWPKNDYLASSTLWSPGAFCNTSFQDGTPDEDIFEKSLDGFFSTCAVSDIPCLDLPQAFSDPEPVPFDGEDLVSELNLEPSQVHAAGVAIDADEPFRQAATSSPEPEPRKKKTSYTPAWKADSSAKTPKRPRKSAKTSKNTTPKSSKRSPAATESDNGAGSSSALRANHNLTEKLYRNRLNGQFETLLSALPPAHDAGDARNGEEKRVSKAEVLMLAKEHIRALEQTRLELEKERSGLVDNVESLKGVWIGMNAERS
ncbi:Allergen Fus c [Lachnellula willkommii]|uniref:Allergen Fus c n=1 Tax=Lachnellula willkommii TaxID=215461 RepID=A0A559M0V3_9HELO|nr:Allergen Fus c [Lachnellula willkommii]